MDKNQAFEIVYKNNRKFKKTIDRLIEWDTTKSIYDLRKKFRINTDSSIVNFARRYGLNYYRKFDNNGFQDKNSLRERIVVKLKREGWSNKMIAIAFGISRARVDQIFVNA